MREVHLTWCISFYCLALRNGGIKTLINYARTLDFYTVLWYNYIIKEMWEDCYGYVR